METLRGVRGRRAIVIGSALSVLLASAPGVGSAQSEEVSTATSEAPPRPGRFREASVPRGPIGVSVQDVVQGGPGFIAVGGGSRTGLRMRAYVWVSDDGMRWQTVPMFGDAADGLMSAIAPLPSGGYVAVGHEFAPDAEVPEASPVNALAWRSDEGIIWERVSSDETFAGSMFHDVTATSDGVVASGCKAAFHCELGRFWRTTDGIDWELISDIDVTPYAIASTENALIAGGTDDAADLTGGQAVISRSTDDGVLWGSTGPSVNGFRSWVNDVISMSGDAALALGGQQPSEGDAVEAGLFSSADGVTWELIERPRFGGLNGTALARTDALVLMFGTVFRAAGSIPTVLWSADLESFRRVRFPADATSDGTDIRGGAVADDGTMAIAVGTREYRPAIWVSAIRS